ncbi:hypothetical protein D3C81_2049450 [compost metagenome]
MIQDRVQAQCQVEATGLDRRCKTCCQVAKRIGHIHAFGFGAGKKLIESCAGALQHGGRQVEASNTDRCSPGNAMVGDAQCPGAVSTADVHHSDGRAVVGLQALVDDQVE